tara:strand:- start:1594 stop:2382 length:789 start_codon:yes stop_codon:yes gene_type:complete
LPDDVENIPQVADFFFYLPNVNPHTTSMTKGNTLGGLNCEPALRPKTMRAPDVTVPIVASTTNAREQTHYKWCRVPKGLIPLFAYSLFMLMFPVVDFYEEIDYTSTPTRVGIITSSFVVALLVVLANDCVVWFNMFLFFHAGVEITVVDTLVTYARASDTDDTGMALAWLAATIIALHLVPFFLVDHAGLLTLLAFAGVVVNASALVFVHPSSLLLTSFSSLILLALVLLIACIRCTKTSLLSQLRQAMREGTWILCMSYQS